MVDIEHTFSSLGLNEPLLKALTLLGYKKPSPIQSACIPHLLAGKDVLGIAQTGSGKTAAFALPLLSRIQSTVIAPQILVLVPTRELAIQVTDTFSEYTQCMPSIGIVALYGGQNYALQLKALKQGAQVVVGTPGRLLDHLRRGTLNLTHLTGLVLDEADEMLRMGFIEDVEAILAEIPQNHQTALFSATMPDPIRRITRRFMHHPEEVHIQAHIRIAPEITQYYWPVYGYPKSGALIRFLELLTSGAALIFVRTKAATLEVAELLERHGFRCAALNGDMNQALREQTLERLKRDGEGEEKLDVLIATDVAARGLDVDRITLVINYDIPLDVETYIHRIGRTGRAGRSGKALLFVEHRERRLLNNIERTLKIKIAPITLPSNQQLETHRLERLAAQLQQQIQSQDLAQYRLLLDKLNPQSQYTLENIAAALIKLAQGKRALILPSDPPELSKLEPFFKGHQMGEAALSRRTRRSDGNTYTRSPRDMVRYRIEVGRNDGVEVRHIVGAIANEGELSSRQIGHIKLFAAYAIVELPKGLSKKVLDHFSQTRILNKPMCLHPIDTTSIIAPRREHTRRKDQPATPQQRTSRYEYHPSKRIRPLAHP